MPEDRDSSTTGAGSASVAVQQRADPRAFVEFLKTVGDGNLVNELTDHLAEIVVTLEHKAQSDGGKPKAKLRLDLTIKLDGGIFEVVPDVVVTSPKPARGRSIMYAIPGGGLSADNPRQYELGIPRDVSTATPIRTLGIR